MFKVWKFVYKELESRLKVRIVEIIANNVSFQKAKELRAQNKGAQISPVTSK